MSTAIGTLSNDYYTLSFVPGSGWSSFWSYDPEGIVSLDAYMYTFKNGQLYRHSVNPIRNEFYGVSGESRLVTILNDSPHETKVFKTIELEGNSSWNVITTSNLASGYIDAQWFQEKEGEWFSYIRRVDSDENYSLRSAIGIGTVNLVDGLDISFSFNIDSQISIGDKIFKSSGGSPILVGTITNIDGDTITLDGGSVLAGNFVLAVKDNVAESYGNSGYYMKVELTSESTSKIELFSIGSELFKSYP